MTVVCAAAPNSLDSSHCLPNMSLRIFFNFSLGFSFLSTPEPSKPATATTSACWASGTALPASDKGPKEKRFCNNSPITLNPINVSTIRAAIANTAPVITIPRTNFGILLNNETDQFAILARNFISSAAGTRPIQKPNKAPMVGIDR